MKIKEGLTIKKQYPSILVSSPSLPPPSYFSACISKTLWEERGRNKRMKDVEKKAAKFAIAERAG